MCDTDMRCTFCSDDVPVYAGGLHLDHSAHCSPPAPGYPYNARLHPTPCTDCLMRIYMQTNAPPGEAPRYVQLELQQDLLGSWLLIRESGRQGGRVTLKRQVHLEHDEALKAFETARDQQLKRGFKVMFTKGTESPHG